MNQQDCPNDMQGGEADDGYQYPGPDGQRLVRSLDRRVIDACHIYIPSDEIIWFRKFVGRLGVMPFCNQMLVLSDDTRGLKASRPMQRIEEAREIASAGRRKTEAGLESVKLGANFSGQSEIVPLMVHPVPLQLIIHAAGP